MWVNVPFNVTTGLLSEQVDNPIIEKAFITSEMSFTTARNTDLGVVEIVGTTADETLNFIPYYAWDNRSR